MKKAIAMILSLTLLLGMTACEKKQEQDVSVATSTQQDAEKQKEMALQKMEEPIDALIRCMVENDMEYEPKDTEFFWTALTYFVAEYGQDHPSAKVENGVIRLNTKATQEMAIALFADYDDLLELPESLKEQVYFDDTTEEYVFTDVADDDFETKIMVEEEREDEIIVTASLRAISDDTRIGVWNVVLTENTYADGITDPLYLYSIARIKVAETSEPGDKTEQTNNQAEEIQETVTFGGLSDSHTVEMTMSDGSIQAFQFKDPDIAKALKAYELDDTLTITYVKNQSGMMITKIDS